MKTIKNMKIGVKMLIGFILVAFITGAMGIYSIINLNKLAAADKKLFETMTEPIGEMAGVSTAFQRARVNVRDMMLTKDPVAIADFQSRVEQRYTEIDELIASFRLTIWSDDMKVLMTQFDTEYATFQKEVKNVVALILAGETEKVTAYMSENGPSGIASRNLQNRIAEIIQYKIDLAGKMSKENDNLASDISTIMIVVLLIVMALAIALGIFLSGLISKPVNKALHMIQEMGKGHLGMRLKMDTKDEVGQMASAMDAFADYLQNSVVKSIQMIAVGNMNVPITAMDAQDEIAPAVLGCVANVTALVTDANLLAKAAIEGKLDTRADASKHGGDFAKIVEGFNKTLDSVIGPLNVAAEYVDRISKGDIPPRITDTYYGDFNEIKNNLNQCIDAVNALVTDTNMLAKAAVYGTLEVRADKTKHGGDFARVIDGVNRTIETLVGHIDNLPSPVMIIDKEFSIRYMNKVGAKILNSTQKQLIGHKCYDNFKTSQCNTANCACAMAMTQSQPATQETVAHPNGMNIDIQYTGIPMKDEMGQVIGALELITDQTAIKAASQVAQKQTSFQNDEVGKLIQNLGKLAKGDLEIDIQNTATDADTKEIGENFSYINQSLLASVNAIKALVSDTAMLSKAAIEGKLDTRADATKHGGDFRRIVEGVNKTLDSVIGPLNVAAEYVDRISKGDIPPRITDSYNGDFNEIKNNLNQCIDAVNEMVSDAGMLVKAAVEGKLNTRADVTKHGGDFRKIVEGVNNTLDAVIEPIAEAAEVLKEMANGNLQCRVQGDYKGDHAEIKIALNDTLDAVSDYVTEISSVLNEMADANLQVSITGDYRGDFTPIKEALNLIIEAFNQTLNDINTSSDQVAAGSRQVSDGSQALSQGATEQASSIEELTASINDIANQTKKNAVNANEANELAVAASKNADQGNTQMKGMLKAMEEINVSSINISKIIKVIDEIAFQTNILALNAAVEAARAGQHGKGFAVVAEEVRNLAARSAAAAKETTALIEGSIQKVTAGTKIANDTAVALDQIVIGVTKAANLVSNIASASNDQATGIAQINQGVEQVSKVIQTNSATAEQSAAASEELSSQAEMLKEMIGKFRLKGHVAGKLVDASPRKMLESSDSRKKSVKRSESAKPKISLSDRDFGKY